MENSEQLELEDANGQEKFTWQERQVKSFNDYLITIIFFSIGWFLIAWWLQVNGQKGWLGLIGYIVAGGPVYVRMLTSKTLSSMFETDDYEVITTYEDGSKSSDHGSNSALAAIIWWVILLCICLVLGGAITLIKIPWLIIKNIFCAIMARSWAGFLRSPIMMILIGAVGLTVSTAIPLRVDYKRDLAEGEAMYNAVLAAQASYTPKQARALIERAKKQDVDGNVEVLGEINAYVDYTAANRTTVINVGKWQVENDYPIGKYYYVGAEFARFEDFYERGKTPSQDDIALLSRYVPAIFLNRLDSEKDSDLHAVTKGNKVSIFVRNRSFDQRTGILLLSDGKRVMVVNFVADGAILYGSHRYWW